MTTSLVPYAPIRHVAAKTLNGDAVHRVLAAENFLVARREITVWDAYAPPPLVSLSGIEIGKIFY